MAKSKRRLILNRQSGPDTSSDVKEKSIKQTPHSIHQVTDIHPLKGLKTSDTKSAKASANTKKSTGAKKIHTEKVVPKQPVQKLSSSKQSVKMTAMKGHPHETVQYTIEVAQKKYGHKGQLIDTHKVQLVISGEVGSEVTLTPRYLTSPKGYQIKNPHQTWKIKMGKDDYKVESKTQNISFDYISERAGTLTIIYTNQNGTQVDTQNVSGYVDDSIGLDNLKLPSGYKLSAPVFQPITLAPHSLKIDLSVRGNVRQVIAPIQQLLYSSRPSKSSTKVQVTGRVGDLKKIEPDQIDVPKGYKIRPNSKQMQLRITADHFQVPEQFPLTIHYVTTEPVYAVINFMDQNQRLVKNQVVRGSWGEYVDISSLKLPSGYVFDQNDPERLRMTKMIQVWRLQVQGVQRSKNATINLVYKDGDRVVHRDQKSVNITSRVGNIYRIPSVEFYRPGFRPTTRTLEGIMRKDGLSKPATEFVFQRDAPKQGTVKPHNVMSGNLSQQDSADEAGNNQYQPVRQRKQPHESEADQKLAADEEAENHREEHERKVRANKRAQQQKARVQRQHDAAKQQEAREKKANAAHIPSKPANHHMTRQELFAHILHTDWEYKKQSGVEPDYDAKY